jgi:hypothetical protein
MRYGGDESGEGKTDQKLSDHWSPLVCSSFKRQRIAARDSARV